jgi:hypothetical protein
MHEESKGGKKGKEGRTLELDDAVHDFVDFLDVHVGVILTHRVLGRPIDAQSETMEGTMSAWGTITSMFEMVL